MTQVRWRIRFFGKVQRTGFRYTSLYCARDLCLTGWVRNLPDGSVLLEAQGGTADLRKLLLRMQSQPQIHITDYTIHQIPPVPGEKTFCIRRGG